MKKFLKFVITIAIIIGIVFGIKYLVENKDSGKYTYAKLTSGKAIEKISKSNIESGLDKFDNYLKDESKKGYVPESVKSSCAENGEFYNLRLLIEKEQSIFVYFYHKSALVTKQTKDLEKNAVSSFEEVVKQIDVLKQSVLSLTDNYLEIVAEPNSHDFESCFNDMVTEYKKVVESISKLNYDMDKIVLQDYFAGNKVDLGYAQMDISTQIIYAYTQTKSGEKIDFAKINEPLARKNALNSLSKQEQQKFIMAYSDIDNLMGFIQSGDKAAFVKDLANRASYEEIGKTIFNIDLSVKTPVEGEGA